MSSQCLVALVGDYKPSVPAHQAIPIALNLAAAHHRVSIKATWIPTSLIQRAQDELASYHGIWCVPASPYENTLGALEAIRFSREQQVPFLGTCGGFQHALMEYAKNVLGMANTDNAELDPGASHPLIAALTCPLFDEKENWSWSRRVFCTRAMEPQEFANNIAVVTVPTLSTKMHCLLRSFV